MTYVAIWHDLCSYKIIFKEGNIVNSAEFFALQLKAKNCLEQLKNGLRSFMLNIPKKKQQNALFVKAGSQCVRLFYDFFFVDVY